MTQDQTPHRRRRRQEIPDAPQQEQAPAEPVRIVIAQDDEPDWLVSATDVSGAASRRNGAAHPPKAEPQEAERKRPEYIWKAPPEEPQRGGAAPAQESPAAEGQSKRPGGMTMEDGQQAPRPRVVRKAPPKKAKIRTAESTKKAPAKKKLSKKARARRNKKIRNAILLIAAAAALIALIVAGCIGGARLADIKTTLDRGNGVFYHNIFVNDIPLEGKTLDQAEQAVSAQVANLMSNFQLTLRTQDGRSWTITSSDLNMKYDVADQLDQLWSIGHSGSSAERYEQVKQLDNQSVMRYTTLTYDLSSINEILLQIKSEVERSPVNATRINDETRWPPYSYTDDEPGQALDITGLSETIIQMVNELESGVVELKPTQVQAAVTREYLEGQIVKLATYETSIGKTGDYVEARHENIRIGTEKFNHLIIKPGESVSFNKVTGKRSNPKNGYQPSLELAYGEYVEGLGGGICQVSSTLYNAVIAAGLDVTERTQHSLPSSYVPLGLDATVSDERLDFVFKNNTGADIFIETQYYKKKNNYYATQFTIYGRPDPNGYTYKLESQVRETLPVPEPTYRPDKDATYVVYDDETKQTNKGAEGYVVDVYLVTLDANGLEVDRTLSHTDTYKAVTPVYYVGVTPRETPVPETND